MASVSEYQEDNLTDISTIKDKIDVSINNNVPDVMSKMAQLHVSIKISRAGMS